jgi:hypothetical protein
MGALVRAQVERALQISADAIRVAATLNSLNHLRHSVI